jgi:thiol-disulfide isomerase/thioredoxin
MPLYESDGTIKASDSRGKVTVVNFWYIYCSACVHELQTEFTHIQENYGDDVEIVVVHSYEEFGQDIPAWIQKNLPTDAGFVHCRDVEGDKFFMSLGGTSAWPITVILDEEGIIQYKVIGSTTFNEMKAVIDQLLEK